MAGRFSEEQVELHALDGTSMAGVFTAPSDASGGVDARTPAVLLCQGYTGVKHVVLPEIAAGFAERGLASLRFDYTGFGESGGERGWFDPRRRVDDALAALAWLMARSNVAADRVGVYGHSYGGPVSIHVAARDHRVRAVVAVSGPGDGLDMIRSGRPSWDWIELRARVDEERARIATGAAPTTISFSELLPSSAAFRAAYDELKRTAGGGSTLSPLTGLGLDEFFLTSVDAIIDFHPAEAAARLGGCSLLLVHGTDDEVAPVETIQPIYRAAPGPKKLVLVPGAGHIDLDAGEGLQRAIDRAADWFSTHL